MNAAEIVTHGMKKRLWLSAILIACAFAVGCRPSEDSADIDAPEVLKAGPNATHADSAESHAYVTLPDCPDLEWQLTLSKTADRAKATGKPILFYFTSVRAVNCRTMEREVFSRPDVHKALQQYVLAAIYLETLDNTFVDSQGGTIAPDVAAHSRFQQQIAPEFGGGMPGFVIATLNADGEYDVLSTCLGVTYDYEFLEFLNTPATESAD